MQFAALDLAVQSTAVQPRDVRGLSYADEVFSRALDFWHMAKLGQKDTHVNT